MTIIYQQLSKPMLLPTILQTLLLPAVLQTPATASGFKHPLLSAIF